MFTSTFEALSNVHKYLSNVHPEETAGPTISQDQLHFI